MSDEIEVDDHRVLLGFHARWGPPRDAPGTIPGGLVVFTVDDPHNMGPHTDAPAAISDELAAKVCSTLKAIAGVSATMETCTLTYHIDVEAMEKRGRTPLESLRTTVVVTSLKLIAEALGIPEFKPLTGVEAGDVKKSGDVKE